MQLGLSLLLVHYTMHSFQIEIAIKKNKNKNKIKLLATKLIVIQLTLLVLGCTTGISCSITAPSIAFNCCTHLFANSSMSSISDVSSVQYLQRIFASSPTFTERVIIHNEINDITNNVHGIPNAYTNSRHVFSKSKRANTFDASF